MGARLAVGAVLVALVAGCTSSVPVQPAPPAFGPTDVMFAQMALAQDRDGDQVASLAQTRSGDPRVRAVASALRDRWRTDSGTLQRWLLGWQQPVSADPSAGAHAGHGDLHALQPDDLASLRAASGAAFERTAVALLLGDLHNSVETTRMESAGGDYPPARQMAGGMTGAYQEQIQKLLIIAAAQ